VSRFGRLGHHLVQQFQRGAEDLVGRLLGPHPKWHLFRYGAFPTGPYTPACTAG
jgi:hypothetical protein